MVKPDCNLCRNSFWSGIPVNLSYHRTIPQVSYFPTDTSTHPQLPKSVCVILQITFPNPAMLGCWYSAGEFSLMNPSPYPQTVRCDTDFTEGRTMSSCSTASTHPHTVRGAAFGSTGDQLTPKASLAAPLETESLHLRQELALNACEHWECKVNEHLGGGGGGRGGGLQQIG